MKRKHIFRNAIVVLAALVGAVMTTACSDWDDHYDPNSSANSTGGSVQATLWENISSNSQLSEFRSLLEKSGYSELINSPQTFTIWAPVNGTFDYQRLSNLSKEKLIKEFIENHIARFSFPASGSINKNVYMLNKKMALFSGSGSYSLNGIAIEKPNQESKNGILHTMSGQLPFKYNIYESLEPEDFDIDSISDAFHSYDNKILNLAQSIPGPVKDGEQTYLDSVFVEWNTLFDTYRADINVEDSNYTMIVPTNEAWHAAKQKILPLYNYISNFKFVQNPLTSSRKEEDVVIDAAYLRDSMVTRCLMQDLFYNNNLYDNGALNTLQDGQTLYVNSLVSTSRNIVYSEDAARLFEGTKRVDKSNGAIFVTDSLRMRTWTSWNPPIKVEAESGTYASYTNNGSAYPTRVTSGTQNPAVSGHISNNAYTLVEPSSASQNPEINIYLPGVRSTTYRIYAVFLPENITNTSITEPRGNRFRARLSYCDANGRIPNEVALVSGYATSDPTKIDTVSLGEFTFPIAYEGTGEYYPFIRLNGSVTSAQNSQFDRTFRIDCILLIPKELDEYIKEHPDYKFYQESYF